ncbi:hypothetical protein [Thermomonas mangrovi]|uniref:hypothetical protein n=1 Tax=Thermomonas mangrovi TaxID=2993316 RepID=UPI0023072FC1|nr:hypothetical protein [Thermomonas mangrovi]
MLKRLGIAATCGIALYGLARYLNGNLVVVPSGPGQFLDLLLSGLQAPSGTDIDSVSGASDTHGTASLPAAQDDNGTETTTAADGVVQAPNGGEQTRP